MPKGRSRPLLAAWRHPHFGIWRVIDICLLYVAASVLSAFASCLLEPIANGMSAPLLGVVQGTLTPWLVSGAALAVGVGLILLKSRRK